MELSDREAWTVVHGLLAGAVLLLAFAGGLAGLWSFRPGFLTPAAIKERMRRRPAGGETTVAVIVWAVSWIVLGFALREKDVDLKKWFWLALVLGALGFVGTFPPIFEAFAAE